MASHVAGPEIERLVQLLARLPGLGPRSARRAALHLIKKREELLGPLGEAMQVAYQRILTCSVCGNIDTIDPCTICQDTRRDPGILLIVETVSDLWALERARLMPARYHVLGGVLSPLDGVGPDDINITKLLDRIREGQAGERMSARPFSRSTPPSTARPPRITSPTCWRRLASKRRGSPMACRLGANSTISTKARSRRRWSAGRRLGS